MTGLLEVLGAAGLMVALLPGVAADDPDVVFRFADPEIIESSGLVVTDDLVVTVNDSGDSARVFTVSLETGETVGVTRWEAAPEDVEALAPAGDGEVWVGDIGDNAQERSSISVTRVPFGRFSREVAASSYELVYPGGAAYDAEALLAHPVTRRLYVVTKGVFGGVVFAAPRVLDPSGPNRLRPVGEAPGLVTDGAFLAGGAALVLRDYGSATVLAFPSLREVTSFALPDQQQGEGLAVGPDGRLYLSSEGVRSPLRGVDLPAAVGTSTSPTTSPSPSPNASPGTVTDEPEPDRPRHPADEPGASSPDPWPWLLGSFVGIVALVVLVRSLRPR